MDSPFSSFWGFDQVQGLAEEEQLLLLVARDSPATLHFQPNPGWGVCLNVCLSVCVDAMARAHPGLEARVLVLTPQEGTYTHRETRAGNPQQQPQGILSSSSWRGVWMAGWKQISRGSFLHSASPPQKRIPLREAQRMLLTAQFKMCME